MKADGFPCVYMMSNRYRGTIYTGVTSELYNRVCNHKNEFHDGFTKRYGVKLLVWYAHYPTMEDAIRREKQIKAWKRDWKIKTIETLNPDWVDLHNVIDTNINYEEKAGPQHALG